MAKSDTLKASGPFRDRQPPGNEIGMDLINTCFSTRICPKVFEQNRFGYLGQAPQSLKPSGQYHPRHSHSSEQTVVAQHSEDSKHPGIEFRRLLSRQIVISHVCTIRIMEVTAPEGAGSDFGIPYGMSMTITPSPVMIVTWEPDLRIPAMITRIVSPPAGTVPSAPRVEKPVHSDFPPFSKFSTTVVLFIINLQVY